MSKRNSIFVAARGERIRILEHDPEKACPALDAGWEPVSEKDHAQPKS
jgi:hypothetical protein